MTARRAHFGHMPDGQPVECISLSGQGLEARIVTLGATLQALRAPDRTGRMDDVVLGGDDVAFYLDGRRFFGAVIGRYANRIAGARYVQDGVTVELPANDGPNSLHGGPAGFDTHVWRVDEIVDGDTPSLALSLSLAAGADGFPGAVRARARYHLSAPGELALEMEAEVTEACPVNMTGHSYFNLAGAGQAGGILDHVLRIGAERFLPVDAHAIPTGPPQPVAGTVFDFRGGARIGALMDPHDPQIALTGGYDHNYTYADTGEDRLVAQLHDPESGRTLSLYSDRSGLQFYSGQFLDGSAVGKEGRAYRRHHGLCLEPQAWPDSPNRPDFPGVALPAGATYRHRIRYAFGIQ